MKIALALTVFAVVVLAFFSDVIFEDRTLITSNPALYDPWRHSADQDQVNAKTFNADALLSYVPRGTELSNSIGEGRLPLWNPYILGGTPFLADPQNRTLYPISLLLARLDPLRAIGYDIVLHVILALIGMYLFLRIVATSNSGAVLGALTYGFSSAFFIRMGHVTFVSSAAWLPFIFYGFERARRNEGTGTILLTAFLVMGYLAGFPQILLFGVMGLLLYAAWISLDSARGTRIAEITRSARILGISGVLSAMLASTQLVPFAEFIRNSTGIGYDFETMSRVHLWPPIVLIRGIIPNFFGNAADGTSWLVLIKRGGLAANTGYFVYCGAGSVLLVCGSLALIARSKRIRAFLFILLFSIGLGTSSLVLRAGYAAIPFIEYSKIDRIAVLACFAISALGGITFSMIFRSEHRRSRQWFARIIIVTTLILLGVFIVFFAMRQTASAAFLEKAEALQPHTWEKTAYARVDEWINGNGSLWVAFMIGEIKKAALFLILSAALLFTLILRRPKSSRLGMAAGVLFIICLIADLGLTARGYYVTQRADCIPETDGISLLKDRVMPRGEWRAARYMNKSPVMPPNTAQVFRIPILGGRSTMVPNARPAFLAAVSQPRQARGNTGKFVPPLGDDAFDLACVRYVLIPQGWPVPSSGNYKLIHDGDMKIYENTDVLEKGICLRKTDLGLKKEEGRDVIGIYDALTRPVIDRCGTARIAEYETEYIVVDVDADEPCFLIFQDNFYPGWRAYIDGKEEEIHNTDLGFRAIEVKEGEHRIVMKFRPRSLRIGFLLTCIGILASLSYIWMARRTNRLAGPDKIG
ncbi:YfhO family protein [Candidatus Eisenbacteria bacterium]|uniref:YfhO family protein n=1 Tax=Eiseniibacteriota bacterium TaxID=2212470 RepID=A0ABV6YPR3_UNCEI